MLASWFQDARRAHEEKCCELQWGLWIVGPRYRIDIGSYRGTVFCELLESMCRPY